MFIIMIFTTLIMNVFSKATIPHGMRYNMHETKINFIRIHTHVQTHTHTHNFNNNNAYTMDLENIKSQAFELAIRNDINTWMDKCF